MWKLTKVLAAQFFLIGTCFAGDIAITGTVYGTIVETNDRVVISNATIISNGTGEPTVKVGKHFQKELILSNVRLISNNQSVRDASGTAGIVAIEDGRSRGRVVMRNLAIHARNADISSVSSSSDVCAGIICNNTRNYDYSHSVFVNTSGSTTISAQQGVRPDARKLYK